MAGWGRKGNKPKSISEMRTKKQVKGRVGEIFIGISLENLQKQTPCRFFQNVTVLSQGGERTVQVDFVLLTTRGFFSVEVKNWSCKLYCDDEARLYWDAQYGNRIKPARNPLIQNKWHAKRLQEATASKYESLVVFTGDVELLNNKYPELIRLDQLSSWVISHPEIYTEDQMKQESYKIVELIREYRR